MAEDKGELTKTQSGISRRDFFKKGALIGAGVILTGAGINVAETNAVENGISTRHGIFFPLYETHYVDIDADKIPKDLDVLFKEVVGWDLLVATAKSMFEDMTKPYQSKIESKLLSDSILQKMATNGTEIMVGDVDPRLIKWIGDPTSIDFLAGVGLGLLTLKKALGKTREEDHGSRRKFLKVAGAAGAAWLMGSGSYYLMRGGPLWIGKFDTEREDALHRIIDRINGLQSNTHPEQLVVFFRNLIMADKMLTVADDFKQKTGRKAQIAFNVEYGHNGVQDFLRVGPDICRWLISRYPKKVLRDIGDLNGGNESLWTARLFKFPKDFFNRDVEKRWENVEDRKVIDVKLKEVLEKKLS